MVFHIIETICRSTGLYLEVSTKDMVKNNNLHPGGHQDIK
jgi:hypothetical protein